MQTAAENTSSGESALPVDIQPSATPEPTAEADVDTRLVPLSVLNEEYAAYGRITIDGMLGSDYNRAMSAVWTDVDTPGNPVSSDIDLHDLMDYETIEQYLCNIGRYDGVSVSVIGKSELGRNIYMVTLNLGGGPAADKPLIMMTGSVHAREFAGAEYIVKFLSDTLALAQTDAYTRALLGSVTIVAVPLVNPDGRELIIAGGDPSRKSNASGVDLNRAMPSANAGQLAAGNKLVENFTNQPGMDFFAGYTLGSESETQALIKWMNVYVPQAAAYIDLHQQGGVSFYNKGFVTAESDAACRSFAKSINKVLNSGYRLRNETVGYGLIGEGGTMTDYARSVAEGFVFSYRFGRLTLPVGGAETPLLCFTDLDNCPEYYQPANPDFLCMSIEIGRKPSALGAGETARRRRATEYDRYGWENFLTGTIETVLGEERVEQIREGI